MRRTLIKGIALMLALLTLLSAVACATVGEGDETTTSGETTAGGDMSSAGETTEEVTETAELHPLTVPEDYKVDDKVSLLYWSDVEMPEFEVEDITGHTVNDQIYWRNEYTEERLGMTFEWHSTPGNSGNRTQFAAFVEASYEANDRAYDIVSAYSRTVGILSIKGFLADLNAIEGSHINLEQPWWPESLVDTVTIGDAIYFISGDISTNTLYFMYGIFCNLEMQENLGLENPMTLVLEDTWTLGKFIEMATDVYADTKADGQIGEGDTFGFDTSRLHLDQFYIGSDLRVIEKHSEDVLVVSADYSSQKLYDLIDTIATFIHTKDVWMNANNDSTAFIEKRALFTHNRLYYADRKLKDVNFVYTVLPTPKYDGEQDMYLTCVGNPFSLYGIMTDASDEEQVAYTAVLEVLGYYGYNLTTPAIFEVNYKSKYSESDTASLMFDYIRNGVRYDLCRIFSVDILTANMIPLVTLTMWDDSSWASVHSTYIRTIKKKLKEAVAIYADLQG